LLILLSLWALVSLAVGAEVRIESTDQPLTILLDGVRLGDTPLVIDVAPGSHVLAARQMGDKTKAVQSTSSDDDILNSIFAESKNEDRVETEIYVTDRGHAVVTFSWSARSADVEWSGEDEESDPVLDTAARDARAQADSYRKDKRYQDAIAAYRQAINFGATEDELMRWILICERELAQEMVTAATERGNSLCERGDIDAAVAAYEEAIEAGGNSGDIGVLISACRQRQNEINVVEVARERADDFVNRGQIKEAIEAYQEAIRLGGPADELEELIRELQMWQASLVVTVTGLDKRGKIVTYLDAGEGRIEPTSIDGRVLRFDGVAAEVDYDLFVGGEGYESVVQEIEALAGRSTREVGVTIEYRGAMELDVSGWEGLVSVRLEQPPVSMDLEPQRYSITAAPAEVVISGEHGTLRWPIDGTPGLTHTLDINSMLPSAVTIEGIPHGSTVEIIASPGNTANGPVFLSSNPKLRRDGAVDLISGVSITDLRDGTYGIRVDHPALGSKSSRFELEPGSSRKLAFEWRAMPGGERIEADYETWRNQRKGPPTEFWLGSGAGIFSAGALGLMASNMAAAGNNHSQFVGYHETYLQEIEDLKTEDAMSTYSDMEFVRNKRNTGVAFATLEGLVGAGTAVLSAWLLKKALPQMGKSKAWSITDYELDGAASVDETEYGGRGTE